LSALYGKNDYEIEEYRSGCSINERNAVIEEGDLEDGMRI
jgi:hypothetical protein